MAEHERIAKPVYKTENYNKQSNPYIDSPFAKALQLPLNEKSPPTSSRELGEAKPTQFMSSRWGFLTP
ncbi:hypothetical protein [Mesorhizobium sp. SP-1A]|uniref:hypothetical protein n=1 Tax=Mesorhizobium sp. SP-1A TaxID=3077840 RepID=UPI0028F7411D|nr:hypothetical protein [Mesorhizobium sp. SP-1A]